jgi:hypothetical protein
MQFPLLSITSQISILVCDSCPVSCLVSSLLNVSNAGSIVSADTGPIQVLVASFYVSMVNAWKRLGGGITHWTGSGISALVVTVTLGLGTKLPTAINAPYRRGHTTGISPSIPNQHAVSQSFMSASILLLMYFKVRK